MKQVKKDWWQELEKNSKLGWIISIFWLLILSWVAFFWNLGSMGLVDKTEALYVEVAHQMFLTNDWITPRWNWQDFFDYPVGGYWIIALSFKLFGVNEAAARFPVALSAIAVVVLCFYTLRYFGGISSENQAKTSHLWLSAWIGAGILALNPAWVAWGRSAVSDMLLSSAIALTMLSFFLGYAQPENPKSQQRWYLITPIFAAIAVLFKGPVGVVLPLLTISCFLLYVGHFRQVLREIKLIPSILLFLAITVPWYVAATWVNGQGFIQTFFGMSNFQRFTSVVYRHAGPWYFYFPWVIILLLPWSIYLPNAIARLDFWQRQVWRNTPRSNQLGLFALFWLVIIFLFFSVAATKLPGYILPSIPAGSILITLFWSEELTKVNREGKRAFSFLLSGIFNLVILFILAAASFFSPQLAGKDPAYPTLGEAVQASGLPLKSLIIWGLAGLVSLGLLLKKRYWRWLFAPNLAGFLAFITLVAIPALPLLDTQRQLPFRQLSQRIPQVAQPGEEVFLMGFLRYSVVYYSQHRVEFFDDVQYAQEYLQKSPPSLQQLPTVLILTEAKFIDKFGLKPSDYQIIERRGAYQLIRVSKKALLKS